MRTAHRGSDVRVCVHLHERCGTVLPFSSIQSDPDPPMHDGDELWRVRRAARMAGKAVNTNLSPGSSRVYNALLANMSEEFTRISCHVCIRHHLTQHLGCMEINVAVAPISPPGLAPAPDARFQQRRQRCT
jgi:hypothetical protein